MMEILLVFTASHQLQMPTSRLATDWLAVVVALVLDVPRYTASARLVSRGSYLTYQCFIVQYQMKSLNLLRDHYVCAYAPCCAGWQNVSAPHISNCLRRGRSSCFSFVRSSRLLVSLVRSASVCMPFHHDDGISRKSSSSLHWRGTHGQQGDLISFLTKTRAEWGYRDWYTYRQQDDIPSLSKKVKLFP